jgi:hypothetical protein
VLVSAVDWSEVTAIATAALALGLVGALGAAVFAAQQVREARISREALMAAEFFRRWNDDALVEARRMFARYSSPAETAGARRGSRRPDGELSVVFGGALAGLRRGLADDGDYLRHSLIEVGTQLVLVPGSILGRAIPARILASLLLRAPLAQLLLTSELGHRRALLTRGHIFRPFLCAGAGRTARRPAARGGVGRRRL